MIEPYGCFLLWFLVLLYFFSKVLSRFSYRPESMGIKREYTYLHFYVFRFKSYLEQWLHKLQEKCSNLTGHHRDRTPYNSASGICIAYWHTYIRRNDTALKKNTFNIIIICFKLFRCGN